jgi:predicted RNA-binding Zn ribbon-like protein
MTGETRFRFVGEHLALDFVNTRSTERDDVSEALPSYRAAVAWFEAAGILAPAAVRTLLAFDRSPEAAEALEALRTFRAALRAMLDDAHEDGSVGDRYVKAINEQLAACGCRRALVREGGRYVVRVQYHVERPRDLLMPVANAAAELIAHEDLTRLKRCGNSCCDMYFLDTSRNRSRSWCEMAACGNRAKATAYYRRHRASRMGLPSSKERRIAGLS